jgi:acetyl/propionyl-CoA carboxylase alpha subunit
LLAKVIASGETRDLANARLSAALQQYAILGVHTNIAFLLRILESPEFREGRVHTAFLDREGAVLAEGPPRSDDPPAFVRAAIEAANEHAAPEGDDVPGRETVWDPWTTLAGWRA